MTLRAELYSSAGEKLDVPPLADILKCSYSHAIGRMGQFTLEIPASRGSDATAGRRVWIYDSREGLVFKGVIRARETAVNASGTAVLVLSGPSVADELNGLTTKRGLIFEEDSLSTVVNTLLTGTDFEAGDVATATLPARRFDGRFLWDALAASAQAVNLSLREDHLTEPPTLSIAPFGEPSGITLRNVPELSHSLAQNDYLKAITSLKVKAQSFDLCNRVIPYGQIEGLGGLQFNLGGLSEAGPSSTRLYLPQSGGSPPSAPISPAFSSDWSSTPGTFRTAMAITKANTAFATQGVAAVGAGTKVAWGQYIYGPLAAQTLAGTVKGQMRVQEQTAAADVTFRMNIRVLDPDATTVRGTPLAATSLGTEWSTSLTNHTITETALTSVDIQEGDYLVVELGLIQAGGVIESHSIRWGDPSSTEDLPENETGTDDLVSWIEFSQNISPFTEIVTGDSYEVLSDTNPDTTLRYYIQDSASIAIHGVREREVFFKDILPLGTAVLDTQLATQTLYGLAVQYLTRHLEEQVAYEVDVVGLKHVNRDTGRPYFQVGDSFRLQFDGAIGGSDGELVPWLTVDRDLYLTAFERTYNTDGSDTFKLTVGTFLRLLPSDGEQLLALAQAVGIEQVAPLGQIIAGDLEGVHVRITPEGIEVVGDDGSSIQITGTDGEIVIDANGVRLKSNQDAPFLSTQSSTGDGATDFSTLADGAFSWLTNRGGKRIRVMDIDKTLPANTASSVTDLFPDGTPVQALFMIAAYRTDTGVSLGHIFASGAPGELHYVTTTDTSAASSGTTSPYIGLNSSGGLDYAASTTVATRLVGLAVIAYSD